VDDPLKTIESFNRQFNLNQPQKEAVVEWAWPQEMALHCLEGKNREAAKTDIIELEPEKVLDRAPFELPEYSRNTLIKSNAFELDCPAEVFSFDLNEWPKEKIWSSLKKIVKEKRVIAVPFRSKVLALGGIDEIKDAFKDNIKGQIERTPVGPNEFRYEDGAIVSLMRNGIVRSMSENSELKSDLQKELWLSKPIKKSRQEGLQCNAYESVQIFIRGIGPTQYLILKPSIKVLDDNGAEVPLEVANPIKQGILANQKCSRFSPSVNMRSSP